SPVSQSGVALRSLRLPPTPKSAPPLAATLSPGVYPGRLHTLRDFSIQSAIDCFVRSRTTRQLTVRCQRLERRRVFRMDPQRKRIAGFATALFVATSLASAGALPDPLWQKALSIAQSNADWVAGLVITRSEIVYKGETNGVHEIWQRSKLG